MLLGMEFNVLILKVPKSAPFTRCIAQARLLIDFLIESRAGLVSLRSRRKMRAMNETVNVLGPTSLSE